MDQGSIICPSCGHQFEISDALTGKIREDLRTEMQREVLDREKELRKKLDDFRLEKEALEKARASMEEQVEAQLRQRLGEAEARAARKAETRFAEQMKELQEVLKERDAAIQSFRANELELRRQQRELQKAREEAELEIARKLDAERARIRQDVEARASEQHRLKDLEKDKVINDLKSALDDMRRKAEQGSMETQGEVLELDFEAQLRRFFPHDDIFPVPKGTRGADLIQRVRTPLAAECGIILWETKNTRAWSSQWIAKLKDDMIDLRAALAILVTVAQPEGVTRFGFVEGVWVSDPLSAVPLAAALRQQLLALDGERQSSLGKGEKMELLYQYLAGPQFKQKIECIVEAFTAMQLQVLRERRAMEKQWKEREKQIERVIKNTVGLYGDMQGIMGAQIPTIETLELELPNPELLDEED